jgi:NAD(P)-dependent dehydrogenase (short-subunit alcohol dehydrogenase family)
VRPGRGDYATSKAALVTLGQVLATELGGDGIRVNTLVPGRMRGPALLAHYQRVAADTGTTLDQQEQGIADQLALPRMVTDEEVARSVVYLLSPLSAGITGQSLDVNAGETFH